MALRCSILMVAHIENIRTVSSSLSGLGFASSRPFHHEPQVRATASSIFALQSAPAEGSISNHRLTHAETCTDSFILHPSLSVCLPVSLSLSLPLSLPLPPSAVSLLFHMAFIYHTCRSTHRKHDPKLLIQEKTKQKVLCVLQQG